MSVTSSNRFLRGVLGMAFLLLAACGGGSDSQPDPGSPSISRFDAERADYFVGERARITAVFAGGEGRIHPGNTPVVSGTAIDTTALARSTTLRLVVSNGATAVERELTLAVRYRDRTRSIPVPFARAQHVALVLADGRVLIAGGEDRENTLPDTVYLFDPATESFSPAGTLTSGRLGFAAALLPNGKLFLSGGLIGVAQAPLAELFDPATGSSAGTPGAPRRLRFSPSTTLLADGTVLIAGGQTGAGAEATAEIFDPATGTFAFTSGNLAVGRVAHTATLLASGHVLLYGGFTNDDSTPPPEVYDPATGTFTALETAETALRANHTAIHATGGTVWLIGGEDMEPKPMMPVLRFLPDSAGFEPIVDLATPRILLGAAELSDGRMLFAGGLTALASTSATDTTEIVAPTGLRRDGPPMAVARYLHTVTDLPNGKVLILGGLGPDGLPLVAAELFE